MLMNGSLAQLWGFINGMQLAAYLPIINVPIPENAGKFSGFIAGIVTFDIPGADMEAFIGDFSSCPADPEGTFLYDLDEESYSD